MVGNGTVAAKAAAGISQKITSATLAGVTFVGAVSGVGALMKAQYSDVDPGTPQAPSQSAPMSGKPAVPSPEALAQSDMLSTSPMHSSSGKKANQTHNLSRTITSVQSRQDAASRMAASQQSQKQSVQTQKTNSRSENAQRQYGDITAAQRRAQAKVNQLRADVKDALQAWVEAQQEAKKASEAYIAQSRKVKNESALSDVVTRIKTLSEQVNAAHAHEQTLQSSLKLAQDKLNDAQANFDDATSTLSKAQSDLAAKRHEVQEIQTRVDELQEELNIMQSKDDDMQAAQDELDAAHTRVQAAQDALFLAQNAYEEKKEVVQTAQDALKAATKEYQIAQDAQAQADEKVKDFQTQLDKACQELENLKSQVLSSEPVSNPAYDNSVSADANVSDFFKSQGWTEASDILESQIHENWQDTSTEYRVDFNGQNSAASLDSYSKAVDLIVAVNKLRAAKGCEPLKIDAELSAAEIARSAYRELESDSSHSYIYEATGYEGDETDSITDSIADSVASDSQSSSSATVGVSYNPLSLKMNQSTSSYYAVTYSSGEGTSTVDASVMRTLLNQYMTARDAAIEVKNYEHTIAALTAQSLDAQRDADDKRAAVETAESTVKAKQLSANTAQDELSQAKTDYESALDTSNKAEKTFKSAQQHVDELKETFEFLGNLSEEDIQSQINTVTDELSQATEQEAEASKQFYSAQDAQRRAQAQVRIQRNEIAELRTKLTDVHNALEVLQGDLSDFETHRQRILSLQFDLRILQDKYELAVVREEKAQQEYENAVARQKAAQFELAVNKQTTQRVRTELAQAYATAEKIKQLQAQQQDELVETINEMQELIND